MPLEKFPGTSGEALFVSFFPLGLKLLQLVVHTIEEIIARNYYACWTNMITTIV
jgi:hypothetical protein